MLARMYVYFCANTNTALLQMLITYNRGHKNNTHNVILPHRMVSVKTWCPKV